MPAGLATALARDVAGLHGRAAVQCLPRQAAAPGRRGARHGRAARALRAGAHVVGTAAYAVVGVVTLWRGLAPGGLAAVLAGGASADSPWALLASVGALVGATTLFDQDVAPTASLALSVVMLVALTATAPLHASPIGAAVLLAAALAVVWATRRRRQAIRRARRTSRARSHEAAPALEPRPGT
jgi:hypothetical protein